MHAGAPWPRSMPSNAADEAPELSPLLPDIALIRDDIAARDGAVHPGSTWPGPPSHTLKRARAPKESARIHASRSSGLSASPPPHPVIASSSSERASLSFTLADSLSRNWAVRGSFTLRVCPCSSPDHLGVTSEPACSPVSTPLAKMAARQNLGDIVKAQTSLEEARLSLAVKKR